MPGLLHDHALRERHRRRPAVPALLRDGHRRSRARVQGDDAARRAAHRRAPEPTAWKRWAFHPQLRIMYVNTFSRVGRPSESHDATRICSTSSRRQRAHRDFSDAPVSRRATSRECSKPRPTRPVPRTGSRGSSSSSATRTARAAIGDLTRRAWETHRPRVLGGPARRRSCSPTSTAAQPAASPRAPVIIVVCADIERGLDPDRAVVDLPRGAEPACSRRPRSDSAAR